jgi:hypothetical protein
MTLPAMSLLAPRASVTTRLLTSCLVGMFVAGCLDHELPPDEAQAGGGGGVASVFIAQQRDFADFEDWLPFESDVEGEHGGVIGTITEYVKRLPESDSDAFPIGTMIVKTVEPNEGAAPAVHAMVKRGGAFNKSGALGWEFFELKKNDDGVVIIVWRGAEPPTGESYRNLLRQNDLDDSRMEVDCNSCHLGSDNDAVLSDLLELNSLP